MDWRRCRLEDDDLVVRPFADEQQGFDLTRDPEIGRYFGRALDGPPPTDPDAPDFAIVEDGAIVGRVWFRSGARPFEIGYFLRPDAWGRGLATRSVRLVSEWLLAEGEDEIVLHTHPENLRSQAVAERAGYRRDGEVEGYADFADGTQRALRFVRSCAAATRPSPPPDGRYEP